MTNTSILLLSVAAVIALAPPTFAAEKAEVLDSGWDGAQAAGYAEEHLSDIIVTGSRIRRSDLSNGGPAMMISAQQLENSAIVNIETMLQRLPAVAGFSGNQSNAYWTSNGYGTAQLNLRGLGIKRTLLLLNGRRLVAGGTGANSSPDLNMIPTVALGRVDVLKDGASAIYGADAVAGVVNMISRRDVDGIQVGARSGLTSRGDGHDLSVDFLAGSRGDQGGFLIAANYQKTQPIRLSSRTPCDLSEGRVNGVPVGSLACSYALDSAGGRGRLAGSDQELAFTSDDNYAPYDRNIHGFNGVPYLNAVNPIERISTAAFADYDLSDRISIFGEFLYSRRNSKQSATPSLFRGDVPGGRDGVVIPADHPSNATGGDVLLLGRRLVEAGARQFFQRSDIWQGSAGLRGKLGNDFNWAITGSLGRNKAVDGSTNVINLARLRNTLDPNICSADAGAAIPCGDYLGAGDVTSEVMDYILYRSIDRGGNGIGTITAELDGALLKLPAGALSFAAGLSYREEKGWRNPDFRTVAGIANSNQQSPVSGKLKSKEAYLELSAPILADRPLFKALDLDLAVRYSDYQLFGGKWNYKLGLNWRLNEQFRLRGTYGTGLRVPNVPELFSIVDEGNLNTDDPCSELGSDADPNLLANCAAAGAQLGYQQPGRVILTATGGNRNLRPESSKNMTIGGVWQPSAFLAGLSVTVDWYQIKIKDAIRSVPGSTKLNICYNSQNLSHPFCNDIERNPLNGHVTYIQAQMTNTGSEEMSGLDFGLAYDRDVNGFQLNVDANASYLSKYEVVQYSGEAPMTYDGRLGDGRGGYPKWRGYGAISLRKNQVTTSWSSQWIGKAKDFNADDRAIGYQMPNVVYHNAQLAFDFDGNKRFSVGADNIFDRKPPYVSSYTDGNSDTMVYDLMGRRLYIAVRAGF